MRERAGPNQSSIAGEHGRLYAEVALEAALDALGSPAFIVGRTGELLFASERARRLLAQDPSRILGALAAAVSGTEGEPAFELRPLQSGPERLGFMAIVRSTPVPSTGSVELAASRWNLTARQAEVLDLVARGLTNATIAEMLHIRTTTVEFHLRAVFDKAGVDNRVTLVARVLEL